MTENPAPNGGCNCGHVRYVLRRPPLTAYICHCHRCQKRTGSAFSMSLVLPADAVEIVSGTPTRTERALASGARNISWVCLGCHSRLWTQRDGAATLNLRAGTLDDTSGLRPVAQFWTSSAQPWAVLRENVLSYAEQPSDFGPLLAAWREREAAQGPR